MNFAFLLLATAEDGGRTTLDRFRLWISAASGLHQAVIILGVFFLVALAAFAWAVLVRKPERRRYSRWRRSHQAAQNGSSRVKESKSRRKHHRKYRSRNPTLAEAGGLPPVRGDEPPPPLL